MTTTFERLCAVLVKDYKLPLERLTLDAPLESLGINSLGTVELLWNVEDAFNIKLPAQLVDLPTLGDVVRYVDGVAGPGMSLAPSVTVSPSKARREVRPDAGKSDGVVHHPRADAEADTEHFDGKLSE